MSNEVLINFAIIFQYPKYNVKWKSVNGCQAFTNICEEKKKKDRERKEMTLHSYTNYLTS